jgi:glycosyltransferase involved in cell wall biosynthesis
MKILITANTCFNLINFRSGLMAALQSAGHELVALAPFDAYTPQLIDRGIEVIDLRLNQRGTAPHREAATLISAFRHLRRIRPDLVLSYTIKNNLYIGMSARVLNIPIVPNITGLGELFNERSIVAGIAKLTYKLAFTTAPTVFFQNEVDHDLLVSKGLVPRDRTEILPGSGVDLEKFPVLPMQPLEEGPVFVLVARLLWEKGIGEYVKAARRIRSVHPGAVCRIVGSLEATSRTAIPRDEVNAWTAEGVVEYRGAVSDIRPELAAAHCVVLPSYYREGTPRSLLEAAASGRPIITTTMPGCRDVVHDGQSGYLISPKDTDALAEAMLRIAEKGSGDLATMGIAGRRHMEDRYDEQLVIRAYERVIEGLALHR